MEIWQTGFTEHRVHDDEELRRHASYIRDNPVRAGIVETAAAYPYSSAAAGLDLDAEPPWLKQQLKEMAISPG